MDGTIKEIREGLRFVYGCREFRELVLDSGECSGVQCFECWTKMIAKLADAIDEERTRTEQNGAAALPEGIQWPRFTDGELVKFGDKFVNYRNKVEDVERVSFSGSGFAFINGISYNEPVNRPEPEVLDADGVPIKVGDTVWFKDSPNTTEFEVQEVSENPIGVRIIVSGERGIGQWVANISLTHRKPDTLEDVRKDAEEFVKSLGDGRNAMYVFYLLERTRKLMGGE